jgi:NADPH:quinone reductase-like Zn-dependent oxidoreductase
MKCIRIHEHGGPEKLIYEDVPVPKIGAGDVLVNVKATSVNHIDLWARQGLPGVRFHLPMIPGVDRVVIAQGISCGHCKHCLNGNDNLCKNYILIGEHRDGADAEYLALPGRNVLPLSEKISFEEAAAAALVFLTAWQMLVDKGQVKPGDDVLVNGVSSGVGSAALQIAKLFSARVIGTTSTEEKAAKARDLGADEVINYNRQNVLEEVRRLTAKKGVEIVIDHVGNSVWDQNIKSLTKGGRLVICGVTSGHDAITDLRYVFYKQLQILGSTMGRKGDLITILDFIERDKLKPVIDRVMPLKEVQEAHRVIEEGKHFGKIVLLP